MKMYVFPSVIAIVLMAITVTLCGGFPHIEIQDGRYEMNVNGSIDTVDVQSYRAGFIVTDNKIPVNFQMHDISRYASQNVVYTMYFTSKRNNFVLLNKDIIITFKKI